MAGTSPCVGDIYIYIYKTRVRRDSHDYIFNMVGIQPVCHLDNDMQLVNVVERETSPNAQLWTHVRRFVGLVIMLYKYDLVKAVVRGNQPVFNGTLISHLPRDLPFESPFWIHFGK